MLTWLPRLNRIQLTCFHGEEVLVKHVGLTNMLVVCTGSLIVRDVGFIIGTTFTNVNIGAHSQVHHLTKISIVKRNQALVKRNQAF